MLETTGIPLAPPVGVSKRDQQKEMQTRMNWLMALGSFRTLAMFTRTRIDDIAIAEMSEMLMDDARWERIAAALKG